MTTYALVRNDSIEQVGAPETWFDGERWWDFRTEVDPASGWLPVVETERPADTETEIHEYSITLVDGQPTETWTARPKTEAEIEASTKRDNTEALRDEATAALDPLLAAVGGLDAIANATPQWLNQNTAQAIQDTAKHAEIVGRQLVRISRVLLGQTDSADTGTDTVP